MNSDPRENPEEKQKSGPDSGTFKRDDSKSPDEEVLRLVAPERPSSHGESLPASPGEEMVTTQEEGFSSSPDEETHNELRSWKILLNKYVLLEKLGEGGMGSVWLVRHLASGERRALKIIHSYIMPSVWERFRQEVQILTELKHPNAVTIHDFGVVGYAPYIEMEYVEGQTLREWLKPGELTPLDKVVWLLRELCEVLGQAHELGIVHRDIKPENIMIFTDAENGRERVKVLDFGMIADQGSLEQTGAGGLKGTPAYMSPEQIRGSIERGDKKHEIDWRSDFYSTGVVLYQLLTGTLPFRGPLWAVAAAHLNNPPLPMKEANAKAEVLPEVERVVLHCLEKKPEDRPQSARELIEAFRKAVEEYEAAIRVEADVSFPTQVLVGKPYHLHVQLVPPEGDRAGESTRELPRPHGDGGAINFLASFTTLATPAATLSSQVKLSVSLVAENLEIDGNCRAEIVVPPEGDPAPLLFSLRGLEVGPGRVMIDFSQGGRPVGSMDLAPEVVADLDVMGPASSPGFPLQALTLKLVAGPIPAPPDLVIKVFEHRLAGIPGRLQFVLSSTHPGLSDLPVLDGDLGTLDLRTGVADWVGEQLRAVGTMAGQPDITSEEAERTLAHIGYNLFKELLPPRFKNFAGRFASVG